MATFFLQMAKVNIIDRKRRRRDAGGEGWISSGRILFMSGVYNAEKVPGRVVRHFIFCMFMYYLNIIRGTIL